MAQLAIKGHKTRGKEVIEILEMLGGNPFEHYSGADIDWCYTIENGYIFWDYPYDKYVIFTLEEFFERFPYKVGDKVQHKGATSCGSVYVVEKMLWEGEKVKYIIKYLGCDYNGISTVTAEDLQPYEEENVEGKITMDEDKGTLVAIDLTLDIKKANEIEVILGDYEFMLKDGKTYFVKKTKYPKTYAECCEVLFPSSIELGKVLTSGYNCEKLKKFGELLICRAAYWKLAGGWEEKRKEKAMHYVIYSTLLGEVVKVQTPNCIANYLLDFPSEEMCDAFFENFKTLIEECRELL